MISILLLKKLLSKITNRVKVKRHFGFQTFAVDRRITIGCGPFEGMIYAAEKIIKKKVYHIVIFEEKEEKQ